MRYSLKVSIYDSQFTNYDKTMTIDEQLAYLRKGTTEIIREPELRAKLENPRSRANLCA